MIGPGNFTEIVECREVRRQRQIGKGGHPRGEISALLGQCPQRIERICQRGTGVAAGKAADAAATS